MKKTNSVLLIEDDEDDQSFFIEAISGIQNTVLCHIACNGKEAIDKLKNSIVLPDIIFTDINMPLMNGIECFLEIVKNPRTKNIPVVFLSTDTGQKAHVFQLGAKGFIQKPTDFHILSKQLSQMIVSIASTEMVGINGE
ncbi:response regulator [Emticicia soli]|uniref:Response regulator n=1 Tax=Emticicia soli TaxID=2027878 RepID=A0ABW5JDR7_9BACT